VKRLSRTLLAVVLAVSAPLAWARPAAAQSAEDAREEARKLADKGYEHYEAGNYPKAIQYFRDAEARFHAPTLLLMLGKAHYKNGGLVEARAAFRRIADEQLPADAPKEFVDAQAEARKGIEEINPRVAMLKIVLKGMAPENVRILIDDVEVPTADVLKPLPQNPGPHRIVGMLGGDEGGRSVYQAVTLKEGTTKQIQLVFRAGGPVTGPAPAQGGCASCEIGGARGDAGTPAGLLAAAAVFALLGARRGRRSPRA
jgi:hypothetical protein